jgi:hypothetical protein
MPVVLRPDTQSDYRRTADALAARRREKSARLPEISVQSWPSLCELRTDSS